MLQEGPVQQHSCKPQPTQLRACEGFYACGINSNAARRFANRWWQMKKCVPLWRIFFSKAAYDAIILEFPESSPYAYRWLFSPLTSMVRWRNDRQLFTVGNLLIISRIYKTIAIRRSFTTSPTVLSRSKQSWRATICQFHRITTTQWPSSLSASLLWIPANLGKLFG